MEDMELICLQIISNAGEARSESHGCPGRCQKQQV